MTDNIIKDDIINSSYNNCYIKSINILKFGRLKNLKIDIDNGFNVIYGKNETGKSTILLFIKAMLYGMPGRKRSGEIVKEREKAVPWDDKYAEGIMVLSANDTEIEIRRRFGKTAAGDKIDVSNAITGDLISELCRNDIGNALFGISEEVFTKTQMITQGGAFMGGGCDELTARLMNLKSSGDEEFSADAAIKKLDEYANKLKCGKGKRLPGRIDILETRIEECKRERFELITRIKQAEDTEKRCANVKKELAEVEKAITDTEKQYSEFKERQTKSLDEERLKSLYSRFLQIEKYEKQINDLKNDTGYINSKDLTQEVCDSVKQTEEKISALKDEIKKDERDLSEINASIKSSFANHHTDFDSSQNITGTESAKKQSICGYILGAVALVLGFIFFANGVLSSVISASITVFGIVLCIFGIIKGKALKKAEVNKKEFEIKQKAEKDKKQELQTGIKELENDISDKQDKIKTHQDRLDEVLNTYGALNSSKLYGMYINKCGLVERINALSHTKSELQNSLTNKDLEDAKKYAQSLFSGESDSAAQEDMNKNLALENLALNIKNAEEKLKNLRKRQIDLNGEIKGLESKMAYVVSNKRIPVDIDTEIKTAKEEIALCQKKLAAAFLAKEILTTVSMRRRETFVPKLNEKATAILSEISDRFDGNLRVSDDYMITMAEESGVHKAEYLSCGAYEQVYFALRFTLCKLICGGFPIFLDDILTTYDDDRAKATIDFLNSKSDADNGCLQIFLFTCKSSDTKYAKDLGVNIINI